MLTRTLSNWTLIHCWDVKTAQPPGKQFQLLKLPYNQAPTYSLVFIVKIWKFTFTQKPAHKHSWQLYLLSSHLERTPMSAKRKTDKLWNSHTLEHYSALKRNYGDVQQMNLKVTILNETNWPQKLHTTRFHLYNFSKRRSLSSAGKSWGLGRETAGGREALGPDGSSGYLNPHTVKSKWEHVLKYRHYTLIF